MKGPCSLGQVPATVLAGSLGRNIKGKGALETAICRQSLDSISQSQQQHPYLNPTTKGHSRLLMASIS